MNCWHNCIDFCGNLADNANMRTEYLTVKEAAKRLPTMTLYCREHGLGFKATGAKSRAWIIPATELAKLKHPPRGRKSAAK